MKVRIRVPLYVDPVGDNDIAKPGPVVGNPNSPFKKGTRFAARENMTEDSHERRMKGLFKTWGQKWRKDKKLLMAGGIDMPTAKETAAQKRERRRKVKLTVAKEARAVQDMARQTAVQALEIIQDVLMNGHRDSDKLAAADIILERAYGKATQPNVNTNVNLNGRKEEVSGTELDKRIETALRGVEELTGRKDKPNKGPERPVNLRQRNRDTGRSTVH